MTNSKTCVTTAILEIGNTSVIGACFVTLGHKVSCLAVQMFWTFYKCSTNEVFLKCYLNHFSANKNTLCISLFLNTPPPQALSNCLPFSESSGTTSTSTACSGHPLLSRLLQSSLVLPPLLLQLCLNTVASDIVKL